MPLIKKLNDYMLEHNKELYKFLADTKELKDFLIRRSNAAMKHIEMLYLKERHLLMKSVIVFFFVEWKIPIVNISRVY